MPADLPEKLKYLQPFVDSLSKLAPSDINEDIDPSLLEAAIRKRVEGLGEDAAVGLIANDRKILEQWLSAHSDADMHPAHWVLGYLSYFDFESEITPPSDLEIPSPFPKIHFDSPTGWKVQDTPGYLGLTKAKHLIAISTIDEIRNTIEFLDKHVAPPGSLLAQSNCVIDCATVHGKKYVSRRVITKPSRYLKSCKLITYALEVPGGCVKISVVSPDPNFDEQILESRLKSLRL